MFLFLEKRRLKARAADYLKKYPEDEAIALAIFQKTLLMGRQSAREIAEQVAGRPFTVLEWAELSPRWERAWRAMVT